MTDDADLFAAHLWSPMMGRGICVETGVGYVHYLAASITVADLPPFIQRRMLPR